MKPLEEVRKILSGIPNINSGGCGFSTLFMYLSARDGFRYTIYSGHNRWGNSLGKIDTNENIVACPHVFLYDTEECVFFDCDSIVNITRYDVLEQIDLEKLVSIIKGPGWNPSFNRHYVPRIEKLTGISLEAYDFECCKGGILNRAINLFF